MDLVRVGVIIGIIAGLFVIIGGIYKFRIWLWQQIKAAIAMWRSRKQMQADIKTLQEQVAAITEKAANTEYFSVTGFAGLRADLNAVQQTVADLQTEVAETKEVRAGQAEVNSDLKDFAEHLSTQIAELQQQVKQLDRGGWLRLGGKQNTPQ